MEWLKALFSGGVADVVKNVTDSVAQFIDTPEKQHQFEMAKAQAALELQRLSYEAEKSYLADRQGARAMFDKAGWLQGIFAMTFLVAYLLLTGFMLWIVAGWLGSEQVKMPEWAQALISAIWGQMSAKVGTICDFLFGSSQGSRDKDFAVTEAMKKVPTSG